MKIFKFCLLFFCLTCLVSCGQIGLENAANGDRPVSIIRDRLNNKIKSVSFDTANSNLAEAPTPKIIKELNQQLEQYTPQIKIISPKKGQIFNQTQIEVHLQAKDFPVFQDDKFKLGNHLDLILDNESSQPIYDLEKPVTLKNLTPGTHTIRAFAARPWGESYKNDEAYGQVTFSVLTETNDNRPDPNVPLLTYGQPTGNYNAEPFLLDFYLTNAPLHIVAQNNPGLKDWRIRATVNGQSFVLENWQPVYLTGLNLGENWIQLELVDESGNDIKNVFNNTVRVINYDPRAKDALAQLVTDQISSLEAQSLIKQNDYTQPVEAPKTIELPSVKTSEEQRINIEKSLNGVEQEVNTKPGYEIAEKSNNVGKIDDLTDNLTTKDSKYSHSSDLNNDNSVESKKTDKLAKEQLDDQITIKVHKIDSLNITSSTQPIVEQDQVEKTFKEKKGDLGTKIESQGPKEVITSNESNSIEEKPEVEIIIPETLKIIEDRTEDKTVITPPKINTPETSGPKLEPAKLWFKKILVSLRLKIEALAKLLPSNV